MSPPRQCKLVQGESYSGAYPVSYLPDLETGTMQQGVDPEKCRAACEGNDKLTDHCIGASWLPEKSTCYFKHCSDLDNGRCWADLKNSISQGPKDGWRIECTQTCGADGDTCCPRDRGPQCTDPTMSCQAETNTCKPMGFERCACPGQGNNGLGYMTDSTLGSVCSDDVTCKDGGQCTDSSCGWCANPKASAWTQDDCSSNSEFPHNVCPGGQSWLDPSALHKCSGKKLGDPCRSNDDCNDRDATCSVQGSGCGVCAVKKVPC